MFKSLGPHCEQFCNGLPCLVQEYSFHPCIPLGSYLQTRVRVRSLPFPFSNQSFCQKGQKEPKESTYQLSHLHTIPLTVSATTNLQPCLKGILSNFRTEAPSVNMCADQKIKVTPACLEFEEDIEQAPALKELTVQSGRPELPVLKK